MSNSLTMSSAASDPLVEALLRAVASPANRAKKDRPLPTFRINIEDRVLSTLFGFDFWRYYVDPMLNFDRQVQFKLFRLHELDDDDCMTADLSASVGLYFEYSLFGVRVQYGQDGIPIFQGAPLAESTDLRRLPDFDFCASGDMPHMLQFHSDLAAISDGQVRVTLPTWWRGPLDIAVQLRGYENLLADATERPRFLHDLLSVITRRRMAWYDEYYRYTGHPRAPGYIGDDWLNVPFLSPGIFEEFVLPQYLDLARFHGGIAGIHSCGNQTPIQSLLLQVPGLQGLECSPWTDLEATVKHTPTDKVIWVALHPTEGISRSNEARMEQDLQRIRHLCRHHRFTVTAGLPDTNSRTAFLAEIEKVKTFIRVAKRVLHGPAVGPRMA